MAEDRAASHHETTAPETRTEQQFVYLRELRAYVHAETGWIRTLTEAIQRGVAGEETASAVGQTVADVASPYRAEMARVRELTVPMGCEAVAQTLAAETAAAGDYLDTLGRWVAAGQVGISLLRDTAGEEVHGALERFVAARDAFQESYTEAARLLEPTQETP